MDTNHYAEDYGDSLPESVAAEFGNDLAIALTNGGILTKTLQKTLVNASLDAANEREEFQTTLTNEIEVLTNARIDLQ